MGLESPSCCSVKQMLLMDITPLFPESLVWFTTDGLPLSFKYILHTIKQSHDLEIIYWYQSYVFKTIMKLIFTEIRQLYKLNNQIPVDIIEVFKKFYKEVLIDLNAIPHNLNDCFYYLMKIKKKELFSEKKPLVLSIDIYVSSLKNIDLGQYSNSSQSTFETLLTLNQIILLLIDKHDHFKCFIRIFNFLYHESDKYYMPLKPFTEESEVFIKFQKKVKRDMDMEQLVIEKNTNLAEIRNPKQLNHGISLNNEECDNFIGLYQLCVEAFFNLNFAISEVDDAESYYWEAGSNLKKVKYFLVSHFNHPYTGSLYNLASIIDILGINLFREHKLYDIKRILFMFVNTINRYSLEFCRPPKHNFLLFNHMTLLHQNSEIKEGNLSQSYIMTMSENPLITDGLKRFFEVYRSHSSILEQHKNIIQCKWKGEKLSIGDIYKDITFGVTSSYYLYEFCDVYFKTALALVYFQIGRFGKHRDSKIPNYICDGYKVLFDPSFMDYFPKRYLSIVSNINIFAKIQLKRKCQELKSLDLEVQQLAMRKLKKIIIKQLSEYGVFINFLAADEDEMDFPRSVKTICNHIWYTVYSAFKAILRLQAITHANVYVADLNFRLPNFCFQILSILQSQI